jgi:hypothetical protein
MEQTEIVSQVFSVCSMNKSMKLEFVPLLQVQRDLYRMPRGWERFREYLQTLFDPE